MNSEGYRDPTADQAIEHIAQNSWMPDDVWSVFSSIRTLLHPLGLSIECIVLYDRTTGERYRWQHNDHSKFGRQMKTERRGKEVHGYTVR